MRHDDPREAAWRGVQYKKNKYEILRHFLGEHIPESAFIFTEAQQGSGRRYVEMTLQKELPRISLHQLTAEQRNDPRLKANMTDLVQRMQYMYRVLGEVNARTASDINLDAKLDLGGISDFVRSERLDHVFSEQELETILDSNTSPNLLVNPDNMQVYCIDFDQGQWVEGMSDAKRLAFEIDGHIQAERARRIGAVATS
ncbi:MAG TPA: hypothetical protein VKQ34_01210 [Candidatus Saccharimonadales bacterium]|nr:hypothetical protein [Candidatus Saccharimonadales bacterium]